MSALLMRSVGCRRQGRVDAHASVSSGCAGPRKILCARSCRFDMFP
ncbi:hypothetical protein ACFPRL_34520 [Pseudoclavibacter helvolus]